MAPSPIPRDTDSVAGSPTIASVFLLPGCDMACRFCGSELDFEVMPPSRLVALIRQIATAGRTHLVLGGGEPLLWSYDFRRIVDEAHDHGLHVQLCTNGRALSDRWEELDRLDRVILPLESASPWIHDNLRRNRTGVGHHALVLDAMERVAARGQQVTISTVITRENVADIKDLGHLLNRFQDRTGALHAWHLYRFLPLGRSGRYQGSKLNVLRAEFLDACRRARASMGCRQVRVFRRDCMIRSSSVEYYWIENGGLVTGNERFSGAELRSESVTQITTESSPCC